MHFIKLEKLINLYEGYQQCFNVKGISLLLIHKNNQNHLFLNQCPHKMQTLGSDCLNNNIIRCPWHGLEFDLNLGTCLNPQNKQLKLTKYPLAYEENFIGIYFN